MKLTSFIVLRPVFFFFFLALIALLLPSLVIPYWYNSIKKVEQNAHSNSDAFLSGLRSRIEDNAKLLLPITSSASNFARFLNSSLYSNQTSFNAIEQTVAPILYQGFLVIPYLAQISYISSDGLFFSYYTADGDRTLAVYSNTSNPTVNANASKAKGSWYRQSVDRNTGKLCGRVASFSPLGTTSVTWFRDQTLDATNVSATLGNGWNSSAKDSFFFYKAPVIVGEGVVSMAFPVKALTNFFSSMDLHGGSFFLATLDGKFLAKEGNLFGNAIVGHDDTVSFQVNEAGNRTVSCSDNGGASNASFLKTGEMDYVFHCSKLKIMEVHLVCVLAFPYNRLANLVHKAGRLSLILLICMIIIMVISIFVFVFLIARAARREMYLCAALIKQMEATQQAERKSMNKSLAFASASHDVRASLAAITGLIGICYDEIAPGTELETNISQIEACTKDLLGILNSILDTTKIEAGKMQLEEEEFNMVQLVEDVVDLYHPVGMKKGVDVVLDLDDESMDKFEQVKGDPGKLKQILTNLLSNAIKFTSEGHVSVRVSARKPSLDKSLLASRRNRSVNCFSFLVYKSGKACEDLEAVNALQRDSNVVEYVIEVDDTGKGIPKEKHKSVFENFVQVKETALGQGGTGLGLGIVQSLVRLMGGEIAIVDKDAGEKGTCFRFNVFLSTCGAATSEIGREEPVDSVPGDSLQHTELNMCTLSPKLEGSHVVLLIRSEERRKIAKKFLKREGLKVLVVKEWEHLASTLKKLENKMDGCHYSSSGKSSSDSSFHGEGHMKSSSFSSRAKDLPLSAMDGADHILPVYRKKNQKNASCVLILIDASAGPFPELWRVVAQFRKDLCTNCCKVLWLDRQTTSNSCFRGAEEGKLVLIDQVMTKPFHGSRLFQAIKLLPEFAGLQGIFPIMTQEDAHQVERHSMDDRPSPRAYLRPTLSPTHKHQVKQIEIQEHDGPSSEKPLRGKKILVVEDSPVFRKLITSILTRLGATTELCENGEEGLELVCNGLRPKGKDGANAFPYDYIFMDCEMPRMDGYEATVQIRKEEKHYGFHIPIIALTAHDTTGEEANRMTLAGMDFHLTKPPKAEQLLEVIQKIQSK